MLSQEIPTLCGEFILRNLQGMAEDVLCLCVQDSVTPHSVLCVTMYFTFSGSNTSDKCV
jgi:hypothetical protein